MFQVSELFRLSPVTVFAFGFTPPLFGAIAAITIALVFHNDEISNYNWQCGRAKLPSLSRIINLPVERTFWQLFILIHVPIRLVELFAGFSRFHRLMNVNYAHKWFYELSRYCYLYFGVAELLFLSALSIIGERENIQVHVILFYVFGFCGIVFFIANIICHRHSLYYLNPYGRISYYLKVILCTAYLLIVPILVGSFLLYWRACITTGINFITAILQPIVITAIPTYEVFAICEYTGVFLNIAFHGCAFFDIRHKVIFCVRIVETIPKKTNDVEEKCEDKSANLNSAKSLRMNG
uniref:CWH43-like N-terminal domain-containing protein n=1 Tax=Ascaris lumbricoides TaxID=6252 RepID=A0A9J2PWH3_ASCLU